MNINELKTLSNDELRQYISGLHTLSKVQLAKQGVGLAILVDDKSSAVRQAVAEQGFGLDVLFYDKDIGVRNHATLYLMGKHSSLATWIKSNPEKCSLPENKNNLLGDSTAPSTPTASKEKDYGPSLMERLFQAKEKSMQVNASSDEAISKAKQQAERIVDMSK